jgi:hypothetical protein
MSESKSKARFKVVGNVKINGVGNGDTVELDSDDVNTAALIQAGHIEPVRTGGTSGGRTADKGSKE